MTSLQRGVLCWIDKEATDSMKPPKQIIVKMSRGVELPKNPSGDGFYGCTHCLFVVLRNEGSEKKIASQVLRFAAASFRMTAGVQVLFWQVSHDDRSDFIRMNRAAIIV